MFNSQYEVGGRAMFTFRNDFLRAEKKNCLGRHEKGSESTFRKIRERMGTISVITNL